MSLIFLDLNSDKTELISGAESTTNGFPQCMAHMPPVSNHSRGMALHLTLNNNNTVSTNLLNPVFFNRETTYKFCYIMLLLLLAFDLKLQISHHSYFSLAALAASEVQDRFYDSFNHLAPAYISELLKPYAITTETCRLNRVPNIKTKTTALLLSQHPDFVTIFPSHQINCIH